MTTLSRRCRPVFVSAGLSIDRTNAERTLLACGIASFIAACVLITADLGGWISAACASHVWHPRRAARGRCLWCNLFRRHHDHDPRAVRNALGRSGLWSSSWVVLAVSTGGFAAMLIGVFFSAATGAISGNDERPRDDYDHLCRVAARPRCARAVTLTVVAMFAVATIIATKGNPAIADITVRYAAAALAALLEARCINGHRSGYVGTGGGTFDAIVIGFMPHRREMATRCR